MDEFSRELADRRQLVTLAGIDPFQGTMREVAPRAGRDPFERSALDLVGARARIDIVSHRATVE